MIFKIKNIASYVSEYIKMATYVDYPGSIELNVENQIEIYNNNQEEITFE